jgi:hypothetical protein
MSVNTDHDVLLGGAPDDLNGYMVRSFVRDTAPQVAARFSTGAPGQTDLDLLKSASVDNMAAGMFQRTWNDANTDQVARVVGLFNKYDENTYPAPPRSGLTAETSDYQISAVAEGEYYSFVALWSQTAGTFSNKIYKIDSSGTISAVALPANLSTNLLSGISGMCLHKKYLIVCQDFTETPGAIFRYDIAANTWQNLSGAAAFPFTIRNQLYVITYANTVFAATNEEAAGSATYTAVERVGASTVAALDVIEFNGAAYIAKRDGIYRFDGVRSVRVLKLFTRQLKEFQGQIYFRSGAWLYSFDGAVVRRLQYFGVDENQAYYGLAANNDYLFINTLTGAVGYVGKDSPDALSALNRVYAYDGVGFSLIGENEDDADYGYMGIVCSSNYLYGWVGYVNLGSPETSRYKYELDSIFVAADVTTASRLEFTTSEFDDGFPNIYKSLEYINLDYDELDPDDDITIKFQTYDGEEWSTWHTAGVVDTTTGNIVEVTGITTKLFKRLKISVVVTLSAASTTTIKGLSIRHTLQPRIRWRWQVGLVASGNKNTYDRNNVLIEADSNALTNQIAKAIKQKTPVYFTSPDYSVLKTTVNAAALTLVFQGQIPLYTDPYGETQLIVVKNDNNAYEILRVVSATYASGTDQTSIVVKERGYLGVTAAAITAGKVMRLCYKVYVTRLMREATVLDENQYAQQTTGESQIQREYLLEITEV